MNRIAWRQSLSNGVRVNFVIVFALISLSTLPPAHLPCAIAAVPQSRYSELWGRNGELWSPQSRLPDFSYAGYHRGEQPFPRQRPDVSVTSFGAKGDGVTDDTEAFRNAIKASPGKVVFVPQGRYLIKGVIPIEASGTVLRGVSPLRSILLLATPLGKIKKATARGPAGRTTSVYSWSGGLIEVSGKPSFDSLATVTQDARRGEQKLVVSDCEKFRVGQDVELLLKDQNDNSLANHIYADNPGSIQGLRGQTRERFACRLTSVNSRLKQIEFDRPLRTDVRVAWQPELAIAKSSVEEVGIEELGVMFPKTPYAGHFREAGYNAISLTGTRNCWIKNVIIHNCDNGLIVDGCNHTIENIVISADRKETKSTKVTGHHGILLKGHDILVNRFEIRTKMIHDVSLSQGASGCVVSNGRGIDMALSHNGFAVHSNLFTNLDLGLGTRMFQRESGVGSGLPSGAYETFWNIRSRQPQTWPKDWGPDQLNLIGVQNTGQSSTNETARWFEAISPSRILPTNLYEGQLTRRTKR